MQAQERRVRVLARALGIATLGAAGVGAIKAAAHCLRSEGLGPRDAGHVVYLDTNELVNKFDNEKGGSADEGYERRNGSL